MPTINKSGYSKDRKGTSGKGDLFRGEMSGYRGGEFWGKSHCCGALIVKITGKNVCEACEEYCMKAKQ